VDTTITLKSLIKNDKVISSILEWQVHLAMRAVDTLASKFKVNFK